MADLVCPVLSAYLRALRTHFEATPMLYESQLEELAQLEEKLRSEPLELRNGTTRKQRALLCLLFSLNTEHRFAVQHGEKDRFHPSVTGPDWLCRVKELLAELAEGHQLASGEMGLMGIRSDDQKLRASYLASANEMTETCSMLVTVVETCLRAEDPAEEFANAVNAGTLLHRVCELGYVGADIKLKYALQLLRCEGEPVDATPWVTV